MADVDLTPHQLAGQLLVVGFASPDLPDSVRESLERGERGGVILFRRNVPSLERTRSLCAEVAGACPSALPPFIGIDEEGGRVTRLPPPFPTLGTMRELAALGDRAAIVDAGRRVGRILAALGFNVNFAPVLDVDSNADNPVIGDRAFSSEPDEVARAGRAFIEGQREGGVLSCGKHFPGHGDTETDSHHTLPLVKHLKERLDVVELPPFRAAALAGVEAMMSAHVVYEDLDPGVPATLSYAICTTLLRNEIGFRGVLFSDDLEMKALAERGTVESNAVRAVRAGCDALLVCSDSEAAARAHHALAAEAEKDASFAERCVQAVTRGLAARQARPPAPVGADALASLLNAR